jgi:hypothetical protein
MKIAIRERRILSPARPSGLMDDVSSESVDVKILPTL